MNKPKPKAAQKSLLSYFGRRTLIVGLCTGAVLFLLLLTVGVLFFETMSVEQGGIGLLCGGLCGGAAAGLLGGGKRSGGKKKRRK